MTGTAVTHVPYKGSAPAVTDLIAGQVQVMFDNTPNVLPQVQGRQAEGDRGVLEEAQRARARGADRGRGRRAGLRRDGLVRHPRAAGTPKEIVARLNTEMVKIMRTPEVTDRFNKAGVDVVASTPEYFSEFLKSEVARWAKVVQDANIKAD